MRSSTLPFPVRYYKINENPILEVLADQLKFDPEWSSKNYTGSSLLDDILMALNENQLACPIDFNILTSIDWIRRMKSNAVFYKHHATSPSEMKIYEDLLLKLAANFLKRTFKLIPILDEDTELTIQPSNDSNNPLYIAYCNKLWKKNFFISVFPKSKDASNNIITSTKKKN